MDRIALGAPILGEAAELSLTAMASLDDGSGSVDLQATRIDGTEGRFIVDASYEGDSGQIDLNLDLTEGPGGLMSRLIDLPDQARHRPDGTGQRACHRIYH